MERPKRKNNAEPFIEYLKSKGLKYTKKRRMVLEEVLKRRGHFDPEELYMALKTDGGKVSRSSVYRTLPLLLQSGLIEEVEKTEKHAHYEQTTRKGHHDHMLCVKCGRIIEFYSEELERLQERLCKERDFESLTHSLEIKGYCRRHRVMEGS